MRLDGWDEELQESLDRAMVVVDDMTDEERRNLLEHVIRASIWYAATDKAEVLPTLARNVLGTIKLHASGAYQRARDTAAKVDHGRARLDVSAALAGLRR